MCSAVALALCLFRVFLCCARTLCVPGLTEALLGIVVATAAGAADGLLWARVGRGASASEARAIQANLLSIFFPSEVHSADRGWGNSSAPAAMNRE